MYSFSLFSLHIFVALSLSHRSSQSVYVMCIQLPHSMYKDRFLAKYTLLAALLDGRFIFHLRWTKEAFYSNNINDDIQFKLIVSYGIALIPNFHTVLPIPQVIWLKFKSLSNRTNLYLRQQFIFLHIYNALQSKRRLKLCLR